MFTVKLIFWIQNMVTSSFNSCNMSVWWVLQALPALNSPGCFSASPALCGQIPWPHDDTDVQASQPAAGSSHLIASAPLCGSQILPTAYHRRKKTKQNRGTE